MKEGYKLARELFAGWAIVLYLLMYTAIATGYFYLVSKNATVSITVGIISSFFLFYMFNVINGRVAKKEQEMRDLNNYVTSVVFYLKAGKNVLHALEETREKAGESIKDDIDKAINSIKETGNLELESFERHNFKSLDIFHQILYIKYDKGGDTNDLFKKTTKDINFEIGKRDELNMNKKYVAQQEYMMTGLVLGIPAILVFLTGTLYDQFLAVGASVVVLAIYFGVLLSNLFFLQKKRADINVNL